uniref:Uncharacterized protein n=1 Tax=Oryza glumipatula TaxID=40148 RepID=A0A0D9ZTK7_9ORYZ
MEGTEQQFTTTPHHGEEEEEEAEVGEVRWWWWSPAPASDAYYRKGSVDYIAMEARNCRGIDEAKVSYLFCCIDSK